MPIKNKDGTEYKLQGPNKIMREQSFWGRDSVILLNMGQWKEVVYKDQQVTPLKVMDEFMNRLSPNEVTLSQIKAKEEPKPEIKPETVVVLPPVEVPPPVAEPPKPRVELEEIHTPIVSHDEKIAVRMRKFSCLPVFYKKVVDELYGDESVQPVYGQKFNFDGVPMENNDLTFSFWTKTNLPKDSIVFQSGVERHGRWWQVQKTEEDSGGYIITTTISLINPDFSD